MEIRNCVIFNGYDLRDYGMYVSGDKTFNSPAKAYRRVSVPGRSGDLLTFTGKYENVDVPYDAILIEDYERNAAAIRSILMSANDYCRLEDSYHKDEYRMGIFQGPIDFDSVYLQAGHTTLTFNCKPQRWLKEGEEPRSIMRNSASTSVSFTIDNPTMFEALPLFHITGSGAMTIGFKYEGDSAVSKKIEFSPSESGDHYIDCEHMSAFRLSTNSVVRENDKVSVTDVSNPPILLDEFPGLKPGENTITVTRTATSSLSIAIVPRWYIL